MERTAYPSDLTDEQWAVIHSVLPRAKNGRAGRPPNYRRREIWNAIFYQARTGCEWRYLNAADVQQAHGRHSPVGDLFGSKKR